MGSDEPPFKVGLTRRCFGGKLRYGRCFLAVAPASAMPSTPLPGPDPSPPTPSATGVFRSRPQGAPEDADFAADFADLAARFASQSGGGLSPELSAELALEIVLNEVVEQACLATGATGSAIALQRDGEMVCRASSGATAPELGTRLDSASGLSGECIRTHRTQVCDDAMIDPRADLQASQRLGVRSVMIMPLLRQDELIGVFELFSSLPNAFGERDERTLEALAKRILASLDLSRNREQATELYPVDVAVDPPIASYAPENTSKLVSSASFLPTETSESHSAFEESTEYDESISDGMEDSSRSGFDFVTAFLGTAVVACAILLGVLLGRHFGFQKAPSHARRVPAAENVGSPSAVSSAGVPGTAKELTPAAASSPAPAGASNDAIPAGSLRVYDKGREIFHQESASREGADERDAAGETDAGTAAKQKNEMKPASSLEPIANGGPAQSANEIRILHRVEPEYPESARALQLQGSVVLDVRVAPDGSVQEMKLVEGQPLLVQAAKNAVQQWKFEPRTASGRTAATQTRVTLNFNLPQ